MRLSAHLHGRRIRYCFVLREMPLALPLSLALPSLTLSVCVLLFFLPLFILQDVVFCAVMRVPYPSNPPSVRTGRSTKDAMRAATVTRCTLEIYIHKDIGKHTYQQECFYFVIQL